MRILVRWFSFVALLYAPSASAGDVIVGSHATVSLLAGWQDSAGTRVAGLAIDLDPGWKTYWRSPGAAGIPPVFDWSTSSNVADVDVKWPAPRVFETYGITSVGYTDDVVFPLHVTAIDATKPVTLKGHLTFGLCADICIPASAALSATWQPGYEEGAGRVRMHGDRVPAAAATAGVSETACGIRGAGAERLFNARLVFDERPAEDPYLLIEGPEHVFFDVPSLSWEGNELHARATVDVFGSARWIGRDSLSLTLLWRDRAVAVERCSGI